MRELWYTAEYLQLYHHRQSLGLARVLAEDSPAKDARLARAGWIGVQIR